MNEGIIYGLAGPDGIRYVGQTRRPKDRYSAHQRDAERGSQLYVHRWWRTLTEPPEMVVLERCPAGELDDCEIAWIGTLRAAGTRLTNHREGGAKGIPDADTRARMSEAQRNRPPITDETRAKLSAMRKGRTYPPEWRAAISAGLRNSESASAKRAEIAAGQVGRKRSPEARARMAEAQRARYARMTDDERKALTANANQAWRARAV